VVGLNPSTAIARLNAAGFANTPVESGCWGGQTNDVVYSQSPSGVQADPSTPIILKYEAVDCEFVPNVLGLDLNGATSELNGRGFTNWYWLYNCYQQPNSIGLVVSQVPSGGQDLHLGDRIDIYLEANNCGPNG
jgi:beta-lactam-binding protein with PASTA domain